MKDIAREFLVQLTDEERSFQERLQLDDAGFGFLTAIKEFDFYYYNFIRNERTEETELHFHMMQLGLPRVIAGIFSIIPAFRYPELTFKGDQTLIQAALEMVSAHGFIEHGRRLAHAAMAGECEIQRFDDRQFDVIMPETVFNMEQHEAEVENHYKNLRRERQNDMIQKMFGGHIDHINNLLSENVYVFRKNFIGYNAHPDLDDFFFGLASLEIQNHSGWDSFHWSLKFGGVTLHKYMLAATYFLSLALKHEKFAETLIKKSPEIRLRDILTIITPCKQFEDDLIKALNKYGPDYEGYTPLTREEARIILNVLSARRENLGVLNSTMAPLPFLIEFSGEAWVTSVAAAQISAVSFLLNSLQHTFPGDYSRNQQTREGSMQKATRRLLSEFLPGLTMVDNVAIRRNGKTVTDIDFAAVDESDGTVMLFQLKHQDEYGGDVRRRSNRSGRLLKEVRHWLDTTRSWLIDEPEALRQALRLRKSAKCERVYLVVIAKHFAHFLSALELKDDAAYATWTQFFDGLIRMRTQSENHTLRTLAETLQQYMSHRLAKGYSFDLQDNYHLPGLSYRIRSSDAT